LQNMIRGIQDNTSTPQSGVASGQSGGVLGAAFNTDADGPWAYNDAVFIDLHQP
jgi:hypothetical protein